MCSVSLGQRRPLSSGDDLMRGPVPAFVAVDAFGKLVDADQLRGVNVPAPSDGLKTVGQVVGRWYSVHSPTLKPKTAHSYANLITSRILPALGSARLNKLRFSDVQRWISEMSAEGL